MGSDSFHHLQSRSKSPHSSDSFSQTLSDSFLKLQPAPIPAPHSPGQCQTSCQELSNWRFRWYPHGISNTATFLLLPACPLPFSTATGPCPSEQCCQGSCGPTHVALRFWVGWAWAAAPWQPPVPVSARTRLGRARQVLAPALAQAPKAPYRYSGCALTAACSPYPQAHEAS